MTIPAAPPTEDFESAALRHLDDASRLHADGRLDNAVYLSGYVQECALKAVLARREGSAFSGKAFGHDLARLGRTELTWWAAEHIVSPHLLEEAVRADGVLAFEHPDRRYWPDLWTTSDAEEAVTQATELAWLLILAPLLDEGRALPG